MGSPKLGVEDALDRIEGTILPSISVLLDTLLDVAAHAQPGRDSEVYAAELRTVALQLETLTRQMEALAPAAQAEPEWPARISA
jgi:hypothetical protein